MLFMFSANGRAVGSRSRAKQDGGGLLCILLGRTFPAARAIATPVVGRSKSNVQHSGTSRFEQKVREKVCCEMSGPLYFLIWFHVLFHLGFVFPTTLASGRLRCFIEKYMFQIYVGASETF